jgi:hypothetical protein
VIKSLKSHLGYYISLTLILSFGFLLVYLSASNRGLQIVIAVLTALFYVFWGIIHHMINHDLHAKIVVEYMLIGGLGLTIVFLIL